MSQEKPLIVRIYDENGYVVVSNVMRKKNIIERPTQTGLSNLKERVRLIMKKELVINEENNHFLVKLPLIEFENESTDY